MTRSPGDDVPTLASVPNLRDVGGHATRGRGRVRTGLLFRSSALNRLDSDQGDTLARLGIRAVYDLRTKAERTAEPDRLPADCEYVVVDVIGDRPEGGPAEVMRMLATPATARAGLGDGRGVEMWTQHYRHFVLLDSARAAYGRLFADLAKPGHLPALVHCTTGKDRTGWAVAALLTLLGVSDRAVMDDFLLSNARLEAFARRAYTEFAAAGGDPDLLRPIVTVLPDYLAAAREEMERSFGTIERYFAEGLGIDAGTQRTLRRAFVERA